MIEVFFEMGLDDGSYWRRRAWLPAVPRKGEYVDLGVEGALKSNPHPFVVDRVRHLIGLDDKTEIAISFSSSLEPGRQRAAEDWREMLERLGFDETRTPRESSGTAGDS